MRVCGSGLMWCETEVNHVPLALQCIYRRSDEELKMGMERKRDTMKGCLRKRYLDVR